LLFFAIILDILCNFAASTLFQVYMFSHLSRFAFACFIAASFCLNVFADKLVVLHTNDTHSQIEPNDKGLGGIQRRKALIDSVRAVRDNVLLIDAGDMVQGTLYFTLFGGEVESKLMNELGYDVQILGNHEFDNGVDKLAAFFGNLNADKISTNYDFTTTPLASIFKPYVIKDYAGRRVGIIAVNLNPKGMIADANAEGVVYLDGIKAANATAWHLKHNEKVDIVIAVTHIGYKEDGLISDVELAQKSEDIDIIIGGHSHTVINPDATSGPQWLLTNVIGKPVLVAQTGKSGINVGEIEIDLDTFATFYHLLPVDARYDKYTDAAVDSILRPYRAAVDEFRNFKIGRSQGLAVKDWSLVNWMADFVLNEAASLTTRNIDLAIVNKGGIRADMKKGDVTKGTIMQIFPFDNRIVVMRISGADLARAFNVMAGRGGDGVSAGVDISFDPSTGKCTSVMIDGKPLDYSRIYTVATIDYLANGGDYMDPLTEGNVIARSDDVIYNDMISSLLKNKKTIKADKTQRMHK